MLDIANFYIFDKALFEAREELIILDEQYKAFMKQDDVNRNKKHNYHRRIKLNFKY